MQVLDYIKSTRPWTVAFSSLIYLLGVLESAYMHLGVDVLLVSLGLLGEAFVHTAVNMLNDYYDYKLGVDSPSSIVGRLHPVVSGLVTPCRLRRDFIAVAAAGASLGVVVTALGRPLAIAFGALGMFMGYGYSYPRVGLKYRAMGDVAYSSSMLALSEAGFYLASGRLSLAGLLAGLPLVVATEGVLHANNWRDVARDSAHGFTTLARVLGRRGSAAFYYALIAGSIASVAALAMTGVYPALSLVAVLSAPAAVALALRSQRWIDSLDLRTAIYSYLLGALIAGGLMASLLMR